MYFDLTCLLLRLNSILTFKGKYPFPLKVVKDRVHTNHRKTDLEMVPEDLTDDMQGRRVGSAVHFSLGLLLQNPYRGYMPLYLMPPFHCILVASGRPGTLWFQLSRQLKCITNRIYVPFYQTLRHVTLIIM